MDTTTTKRDVLVAAFGLLGDGNGSEWDDNTEYTRAMVELVRDAVGVPEGTDDGPSFILGMIYGAGLVTA